MKLRCRNAAFCRDCARCNHGRPHRDTVNSCTVPNYCAAIDGSAHCTPEGLSLSASAAWTYAPADGVSHD